MAVKHKLIGLILIVVGAFPLLLKIQGVATAFEKYTFLSYLVPGGILYQAIIIVLGVWCIWTLKPRTDNYRR